MSIQTLEELLLIFLVLYFLESITLLRPRHLLYVANWGRRFAIREGGFHLRGMFPWSRAFSSHRPTFVLGVDGVYVLTAEYAAGAELYERESFEFLAYQELDGLAWDQTSVRWNRRVAHKLPSLSHASTLVAEIRELQGLKRSKRLARIKKRDSHGTNLEALESQRNRFKKSTVRLMVLSAALFGLLFVALPSAILLELVSYPILGSLFACLLLIQLGIFVGGALLMREMKPHGIKTPPGTLTTLLLFPPAALHASSTLTKDLLASFDHLAIAGSLFPRERFARLVRAELYGIEHALSSSDDAEWKDAWERRRGTLRGLLEQVGLSEAEVMKAVPRRDHLAASRCPFCEDEYLAGVETCVDCGMPLVRFQEVAAA